MALTFSSLANSADEADHRLHQTRPRILLAPAVGADTPFLHRISAMVSWALLTWRFVPRWRCVATGGFQCDSGLSDGAQGLLEYSLSICSSLPAPPRPMTTSLMRWTSSTKPAGFCHGSAGAPGWRLLLLFQDHGQQYPCCIWSNERSRSLWLNGAKA